MHSKKKVAIVGSGCTGLAALWALKSTDHEVHLYEAKHRLGGHTNTVTFSHEGKSVQVDTGFIVMNSATYRQYATCRLSWQLAHNCSQFHRVSQAHWDRTSANRYDFWRFKRCRTVRMGWNIFVSHFRSKGQYFTASNVADDL